MSEQKCPECDKILIEQEIMEATCFNCGDFWCCSGCLERDTELKLEDDLDEYYEILSKRQWKDKNV